MNTTAKVLLGVAAAGELALLLSGDTKPQWDQRLTDLMRRAEAEDALEMFAAAYWLMADLYTTGAWDIVPTADLFEENTSNEAISETLRAALRRKTGLPESTSDRNLAIAFWRTRFPNRRELPYMMLPEMAALREPALRRVGV